ncbi:MAG: S1 RNA-binding domain-containing protein, partial [Cytophagales bacterium]
VHQDGLVHVSQLSDTFVSDPKTIVKVAQKVMVTVTEIDVQRKRIALTMKGGGAATPQQPRSQSLNAASSKPANKSVSQPVSTPQKEESYEDKLAQLKNMFKK